MEYELRCTSCYTVTRSDPTTRGQHVKCQACASLIDVPNERISAGVVLSSRYLLLEKVGCGGSSEVWKAEQKSTARPVAIKMLRWSMQDDVLDRFQKEIKLLAKLDHPVIVPGIDAGVDDDMHYLVMSYVDGETLSELVQRDGPLSERQALHIALTISEAMDPCWRQFKLVHRDLKPANIMKTRTGAIKLLDLGIARTQESKGHTLTPVGGLIGTLHTISPEQIERPRDVTCRSDLYSLGCTLYYLLLGQYPFSRASEMALVNAHLSDPPPNPQALRPDLSSETSKLILDLLQKDPGKRPSNWTDLIARIRDALQHASTQTPPRQSPVASTNRWFPWLFGICVLALFLGLAWAVFWPSSGNQPQAQPQALVPEVTIAQGVLAPPPSALPAIQAAAAAPTRRLPPLPHEPDRVAGPNLRNLALEELPKKISFIITDTDTERVDIPMNLVRPGRFMMGRCDTECRELPGPPGLGSAAHAVEITRPFYLAVTECTYEQFCHLKPWRMEHPDRRHEPAFDISWRIAADKELDCLQLAAQGRFGSLLPEGYEFRLPTEAEWEYACRAGSTTIFPQGDEVGNLADYANLASSGPRIVGSLKPNAWGFHDMLGNVAEWVFDGYAPYPANSEMQRDPYHAADGSFNGQSRLRVLRGGSYLSPDPYSCSPGFRSFVPAADQAQHFGFRLAIGPRLETRR